MKRGRLTKFKLNPKKPPKTDWRSFDAMSAAERHRAAAADPDAPPASKAQLARARRVRNVRHLEDIEDTYLARRRLSRGGARVSLESLERGLTRRSKR